MSPFRNLDALGLYILFLKIEIGSLGKSTPAKGSTNLDYDFMLMDTKKEDALATLGRQLLVLLRRISKFS